MDPRAAPGVAASIPVVWTGPAPLISMGVVLEELHAAGGRLALYDLAERLDARCRALTAADLGDVLNALESKRFIGWSAAGAWLLPGFGVR